MRVSPYNRVLARVVFLAAPEYLAADQVFVDFRSRPLQGCFTNELQERLQLFGSQERRTAQNELEFRPNFVGGNIGLAVDLGLLRHFDPSLYHVVDTTH